MPDVPGTVHIPAAIRAFNAIVNPLERPRLSATDIERYATAECGGRLTTSARCGLESLCDDAETAAGLSALGRFRLRTVLRDLAVNRLGVENALARQPATSIATISRPIFILGLPRSGTTILFNLLAQDPAHRSPLTWEVEFPCPAPAADDYTDNVRIRRCQNNIDHFHRLAPSFNGIHPQGARLAEEDQRILAMNFAGCGFQHFVQAPLHQRWQFEHDALDSFRWHRRFLTFLETHVKKPRWLLKSPDDQLYLGAINEVYPDALIVHTHRHPAEAIPSVGSLTYTVRRLFARHTDPAEVGRDQLHFWSEILNRCVADRDALDLGDRIIDVQFADLVAEPMRVVAAIYARFGLDLDGDTERAMHRFLANNKRHRHGVHAYTLEQFGLSNAVIEDRFGPYIRRYIQPGE